MARKPVPERRKVGGVEKAVRAELRRQKCSVQSEGLGALAVALAQQIDSARGAVAAAAAAGQLRLLLFDVAKTAAPSKDVIDELNARRAVKRAAG